MCVSFETILSNINVWELQKYIFKTYIYVSEKVNVVYFIMKRRVVH